MDLTSFLKPSRLLPIGASLVLFVLGIAGALSAAWGYGLLLIATISLALGCLLFFVFILSHRFDTDALRAAFTNLLAAGAWCYVIAISALAGYFSFETLNGRMEAKWILFGPVALASIVALDWGLYRLLVRKNLPTWQRYGHLISREASDPEKMRQTLVDDVILHRSLMSVSGFRWFKHTLIFWGFSVMFAVELAAVFVREAVPAFGMRDVWDELDHPIRQSFDFAFDFTGLMVLVGCALALIWRVVVHGKPEQKFTDTPTALFLFFVVVSGFLLEGVRIAAGGAGEQFAASFVGVVFAGLFADGGSAYAAYHEPLWLVHVIGSCAFIAYVPAKRLVHSCATPMGRLMNSQTGLMAAKKQASLKGMLIGKSTD